MSKLIMLGAQSISPRYSRPDSSNCTGRYQPAGLTLLASPYNDGDLDDDSRADQTVDDPGPEHDP